MSRFSLTSRGRAVGVVALCVSFLLMIATAFADGKQDFTLHNGTGLNMNKIFLAPHVDGTPWQEFVIDGGVMKDGEDVDVTFDGTEKEDNWDLRLVDQDGKEYVWGNLNLPAITDVTISLKDGKAWADTKSKPAN